MVDDLDPEQLEQARISAKLSRAELASRAGVNETTILRIETGLVDPRVKGTWAPIVRALRAAERPNPAEKAA